jgi:membrane protein implicated in regulation of membrane protease activity
MSPWIMIAIWSVFIIVTVIIELETADLITIWFTAGAVGALIAAAFEIAPLIQIGIFLVISILLLLITRPLTKNISQKNFVRTNADRVIGMIATVTIDVTPDEIGEVKVGSVLWRAISLDQHSYQIGEKVQVDAISGTKLIISKIDNKDFIAL